jgi:hypothetical protein
VSGASSSGGLVRLFLRLSFDIASPEDGHTRETSGEDTLTVEKPERTDLRGVA